MSCCTVKKDMDARDKRGHDEGDTLLGFSGHAGNDGGQAGV
jgi:hypothetical protein